MFSLIITIISIALVAALALATLYYGGDAFNQGTARAEAAKVLLQGQQLMGATELFIAREGRVPLTLAELVSAGYLKTLPVAQLAVGQAQAVDLVWEMPVSAVPVFLLPGVDAPVCQAVNGSVLGQNGILELVHVSQGTQCYGAGPYQVVFAKSSAALQAVSSASPASLSMPASIFTTNAVPDASNTAARVVPPGVASASAGGTGGSGGSAAPAAGAAVLSGGFTSTQNSYDGVPLTPGTSYYVENGGVSVGYVTPAAPVADWLPVVPVTSSNDCNTLAPGMRFSSTHLVLTAPAGTTLALGSLQASGVSSGQSRNYSISVTGAGCSANVCDLYVDNDVDSGTIESSPSVESVAATLEYTVNGGAAQSVTKVFTDLVPIGLGIGDLCS